MKLKEREKMKYLTAIIIVLMYTINVPQASKVHIVEAPRQSMGKLDGVELFV